MVTQAKKGLRIERQTLFFEITLTILTNQP